jgi:hypothetical protein
MEENGMTGRGYIKLYRSIFEWEWFYDINTRTVYMYLLLAANFKDGRFKGRTILRGQLLTSYAGIARENCMSLKNARTAIAHLKKTGEICAEPACGGLLVTVNNYGKFQSAAAGGGQEKGRQKAPIEKGKKGNKKENENKRGFVVPERGEVAAYAKEKDFLVDAMEFYDFYESNGWMVGKAPMRCWKAAMSGWNRRKQREGAARKDYRERSYTEEENGQELLEAMLELERLVGK